jgi:hypothetical protein
MPSEATPEDMQLVSAIIRAILRGIEDGIDRLWPEEPVIVSALMTEYNFRQCRTSLCLFVRFAQGTSAHCLVEPPDFLHEIHSMCSGIEELECVIDLVNRIHKVVEITPLYDRSVKIEELGLKPAVFSDLLK